MGQETDYPNDELSLQKETPPGRQSAERRASREESPREALLALARITTMTLAFVIVVGAAMSIVAMPFYLRSLVRGAPQNLEPFIAIASVILLLNFTWFAALLISEGRGYFRMPAS